MHERIFLGPNEGPAEEIKDQNELRDLAALRQIHNLLEKDTATQERFRQSGRTRKEFIDEHIRNFGGNGIQKYI